MFGSLGFTELVLILMIVLIIFGAGKLPQLGEGIGKAIKGFKKSVHEVDAMELEAQAQQTDVPPPAQAAAPSQGSPQEGGQQTESVARSVEAVEPSKV